MAEKTCAFTGHRILSENICDLRAALTEQIKHLILDYNINEFTCGGARGFDMLAAEAVLSLKAEFPMLRLVMVLPCKDQDKYWSEKDKLRHAYILAGADDIIYLSETYDDTCMLKRNRYLIDNCSVCLCYKKSKRGGTAYTVKYAQKHNKHIINLAESVSNQLLLNDFLI